MEQINPQILKCHFKNGMMILPFYHSILTARRNQQTFAHENVQRVSTKQRLLSLLKGLRYCKIKRKDILIFSSTLFNVKKDGRYVNCLHSYYYNLYPDNTLLIEDCDNNYIWRTKNSCDNLSLINTYIEQASLIMQKICHIFNPIKNKDYNAFIEAYPEFMSAKKLSKDDYYIRFYSFFLKILLKKVSPKVVIVNCASYGNNAAIICYVAKSLGIKVIEPQHGVTYKSPGYVTSDVIANSEEYQKYLPDVLFTFGDYWKVFVKWNYEKVSVGYQFLNEYSSRTNTPKVLYDYLIISQPMNSKEEKKKISFVKSLSIACPQSKILFRIHPAESYSQQVETYMDCANIEISNSTSILYDDFNKCKNIVGWYSNCLYECIAFQKVPIIVDTEYTRSHFPENIGVRVKDAEELKMLNMDMLQSTMDYSKYWASDFNYRVKNYLENILNNKNI